MRRPSGAKPSVRKKRTALKTMNYQPGDHVEKKKGYRWPGVVVAAFLTTRGEPRVVVECTVPEVEGALHIYHPDQLRKK